MLYRGCFNGKNCLQFAGRTIWRGREGSTVVFVPDTLVLDASHIHCVRQFNHYAMGRAKAFTLRALMAPWGT